MPVRDTIVVGASAGGVEALQELLSGLGPDLPATVVVVLHTPASTVSTLAAILDRSTGLSVSVATEGMALKRGQVTVARPGQSLAMVGGEIFVAGGAAARGHRHAVDVMFRSAAQALGPRVIGVVLSGSLDDGSAGLVDLRTRGGVGIVQEPADARHADMPDNAIAASAPEHILPVAKIPALLTRLLGEKLDPETHVGAPSAGSIVNAGGSASADRAPTTSGDVNVTSHGSQPAEDDLEAFERLLVHIKESRGFDFTGYKRSSLMRRLDLRMRAVRIEEYDAYRDFLELHPEEFTALFNAVLINVTSFFRDTDPWAYLRSDVLPGLIKAKGESDPIRVWSAGCASGQEAYSLALVLAEQLGIEAFRRRVKIYATDVDEEALAEARQATFTDADLKNVPKELVETFFEATGQRMHFSKDLRRNVIFGRNDLVQDAPISHIDLLVCRNILMYFNAEAQASIIRRLHFALDNSGVLFLGKAEMLLSHGALFLPIDLKRRFFRKVVHGDVSERVLLVGAASAESQMPTGSEPELHLKMLNASPVAQIAIGRDGRVVLSNERAEALFGLSGREIGRPFHDLEISYRPVELRTPIQQATAEGRPVWVRDVEWPRGAHPVWYDVQIVPLIDSAGDSLGTSLFFSDVTRYRQLQGELELAHRQLESAYEELQSTNEELETTNEELQSTVEELETTNEELQSTNEELETMNEELQSMNDELHSSNDELRSRTSEVGELNNFMESVLTAMRAGVMVVDRDLRIQVWNVRSEDLWGARQEEVIGQHLLNLDIGIEVDRLKPLVRRALSPGEEPEPVQLQAVNRRGRAISVTVAVTSMRSGDEEPTGALIVISEIG